MRTAKLPVALALGGLLLGAPATAEPPARGAETVVDAPPSLADDRPICVGQVAKPLSCDYWVPLPLLPASIAAAPAVVPAPVQELVRVLTRVGESVGEWLGLTRSTGTRMATGHKKPAG